MTASAIGAVMPSRARRAGQPCGNIYFRVPDIDAAADAMKAGGGRSLMGPMEVPGGDGSSSALDPQGALRLVGHASN